MVRKGELISFLDQHKVADLLSNAVNDLAIKRPEGDIVNHLVEYLLRTYPAPVVDKVIAREILDGRSYPTVEVDLYCKIHGIVKMMSTASVPSASFPTQGEQEACELRDNDLQRYGGRGVSKAVTNVVILLGPALRGKPVSDQAAIDRILWGLDSTEKKSNVGVNAILPVSMAVARAAASLKDVPLFQYLAPLHGVDPERFSMPMPMVNLLSGGKHAVSKVKLQEFLLVPRKVATFREAVEKAHLVYQQLGKAIAADKGAAFRNITDQGSYSCPCDNADEALHLLEEAIEAAGMKPGRDMLLGIDCGASEFFNRDSTLYEPVEVPAGKAGEQQKAKAATAVHGMNVDDLITWYEGLIDRHPSITYLEDPIDFQDYEGWKKIQEKLAAKVMLAGDRLFSSNAALIKQGQTEGWGTVSACLKMNQVGTVSDTIATARLFPGPERTYKIILCNRSGETTDPFVADMSVAVHASYVKFGAPVRERVTKYNRLLHIESILKETNKLVPMVVPEDPPEPVAEAPEPEVADVQKTPGKSAKSTAKLTGRSSPDGKRAPTPDKAKTPAKGKK